MNALSELKRMPESKAEVETFAYAAVGELMDGIETPVEIEVRLKLMEETIKLIRKDPRIKMLLIEQVESGNNTALGADLTLKQRATWSFTDPELVALKAKVKARETLLKQMKGVDPDTGEIVGYQTHTEFINIKLK